MANTIEQKIMEITRTLPFEAEEVFRYFVSPRLLEQWSAPEGMTLEVPKMEAREKGLYRYEHKDQSGALWVCDGFFKAFVRAERLVMVDNVSNPKGDLVHANLECIIDFKDLGGTTEVHIRQRGFENLQAMRDCKQGWTQCLDKLEPLMISEGSLRHSRRFDGPEARA